MAHLMTKVAEYAVILNSKNEFLMVQFGKFHNFGWHFPGGRLEENEDSIVGLIREIKEETNLDVTNIRPVFTKVFHPEDPKYGVFFLAKAVEPYEIKITSEHNDFKWYKKCDLDKIDFWQPFYKKMLEDNL
jgi:8-oxo-dGTP diphosphatase